MLGRSFGPIPVGAVRSPVSQSQVLVALVVQESPESGLWVLAAWRALWAA